MHNLELRDELDSLKENIKEFMILVEEALEDNDEFDDNEYEFLEDESGVSNTELDNLLETLDQAIEAINQLRA